VTRASAWIASVTRGGASTVSALESRLVTLAEALTTWAARSRHDGMLSLVMSAMARAFCFRACAHDRRGSLMVLVPSLVCRLRNSVISSNDLGQSDFNNRDSARSARSFPPVWHVGQ